MSRPDLPLWQRLIPGRATLAFTHDLLMAALVLPLALQLRVGATGVVVRQEWLWVAVPIFVVVAAGSYRFINLYRGIWRYASIQDLLALLKAVSLTTALFIVAMFMINRYEELPRSVPFIAWMLHLGLLGGPRFAYRIAKDRRLEIANDARPRQPVLLVGAGDGAEMFIRAMRSDRLAEFNPVAILDDSSRRLGRRIHGVQIIGTIEDVDTAFETLSRRGQRPQRLILTRQRGADDADLIGRLVERAQHHGATVARLPSLTEFKDATPGSHLTLKPIQVEDLLGRPEVELDIDAVTRLIAGQRVLITGAGGTIGSELTRQVAALSPAHLSLVDAGEFNLYSIDLALNETGCDVPRSLHLADVRDRAHIHRLMEVERPAIVFHAAALKHVPMVELNPCEGVLTNAIGTRNVADAARAADAAAMVLISTDKAVSPTNVMGASKRLAEIYCQALDVAGHPDPEHPRPVQSTRFLTVRFGNVLGSTGSVVPLFERQLKRGGPLTVTHPDVERYFMTCREAVQLVLQASAYGLGSRRDEGKLFVLDMGRPVKIADLARQMIRLAGLEPDRDVAITFTGLRPGEKLTESLFWSEEPPVPTEAAGVLVASTQPADPAIMARALDELASVARTGDGDQVRQQIARIIPDFPSGGHQTAPIRAQNSA